MKKVKKAHKKVSSESEEDKGFVWYYSRRAFYVMAFLWLLVIIFPTIPLRNIWLYSVQFILSLFVAVTSLLHIFKHQQRTFAIIAAAVSIIGLLFLLLMAVWIGS